MNCGDLDDLRDQGIGPAGEALPQSAREHLRECDSCRKLQEIWILPDETAELPGEVGERVTKEIIGRLRPVSPLPSDGFLLAAVLILACIGVSTGVACFDLAGWRAMALWQAAVIFPLLALGILLMARVVTRQMVPGALQTLSSGTAIVGICAVLLTGIILLFPYTPDARFVSRGLQCWGIGLGAAAGASILFQLILRRGAWLSPIPDGAAAGLLSGLVGLTVLDLHCPYLDRAHRGFWHLGAALTAVLLGMVVAVLGDAMRTRQADQF